MAATFRSQERGHTEPGLQAGWHFGLYGKGLGVILAMMDQARADGASHRDVAPLAFGRHYKRRMHMPVTLGGLEAMDERSVTISAEYAAAVDQAVSSGEYGSPNEVVAAAIRDWKERRENHGYTIAELRRLVQEGMDSGPSAFSSMAEIKSAARVRWNERTAV